jgi:hypothetical protein
MRIDALHCLCRHWWEAQGRKSGGGGKINTQFVSSHPWLGRVIQSIKTIGTLLLKALECSFAQRGHSLAFTAPLKQ